MGTVILLILDWRMGLPAAIVWPWCLLVPPRIAKRAGSVARVRKEREPVVLEIVHEAVAAQAVVCAYGLQRLLLTRFFQRDAKLFESGVEATYLTAMTEQSTFSGILLLQVLTLGIGAWRAFHGHMTIGTLAAFQALSLGVGDSLFYCPRLGGLKPSP